MATSCDYVGTVLVEKILDPFTSNCGRNVEKIRYRGNAVIDKLSAVVRRGSSEIVVHLSVFQPTLRLMDCLVRST